MKVGRQKAYIERLEIEVPTYYFAVDGETRSAQSTHSLSLSELVVY